jgi:hypothetical protein
MKKTLAEFKFCHLGKHFYETKQLRDSVMWDTLLCQRYGTTAGKSRSGRTIDQKMVAVHGSPCALTPLILILIVIRASDKSTTRPTHPVILGFKIIIISDE